MNKRPSSNNAPDNKARSRRRRRPTGPGGQPKAEPEVVKKSASVLKKYSVTFYENHNLAREDTAKLQELKSECDQLNIVVKAEGTMDDPELTQFGRIYAGEAWHLIHKRRQDDGWYNEMHE
ncbi:MAG: hypothetical protein H7249_16055 [Chitinophagaceae bacterium]|nr:hypothetical protein [Oligoflexus sp.]